VIGNIVYDLFMASLFSCWCGRFDVYVWMCSVNVLMYSRILSYKFLYINYILGANIVI